MSTNNRGEKGDILLEMKDIVIDGYSDERWHEIIKGVDLTLKRGEVLGLIGESGGAVDVGFEPDDAADAFERTEFGVESG